MDTKWIDVTAALGLGAYLLYRGDKVVYVGKSKCPLVRIAAHRSLQRKKVPTWLSIKGIVFDRAEVIPSHPDRIDELEQALIKFYKPVHNKAHNPEPCPAPIPSLYRKPPLPTVTRRL
jgi:hypothetical protein